jgi:hypothetical protein
MRGTWPVRPRSSREAPIDADLGSTGPIRHYRVVERALTATVLAPYFLLGPGLVVIGQFDGPAGTSVGVLIWVATVVLGLVLLVPFGYAYQGFGTLAYHVSQTAGEVMPVDWGDRRWAEVRRVIEAQGDRAETIRAVSLFSTTANPRVAHVPVQAPGVFGTMSAWSVRHSRPLVIGGAAAGLTVGILNELDLAWWHTVAGAAPYAVLLLLPVIMVIVARTMPTMLRMNIRNPRFALVIPSQWKREFRKDPVRASALLGHELSHIRHRDALHRHLLGPYRNFATILVFIDAGSVIMAVRTSGSWPLVALLAVTVAGVLSVRRAYPQINTVQELRADAEATVDAGAASALADFVAQAGDGRLTGAQVARIAALRGDERVWSTGVAWRAVVLGVAGFAVPVVVMAVLLLSGVFPASV